eukprot:g287.t1
MTAGIDSQKKIMSEILPMHYKTLIKFAPPGSEAKYPWAKYVEDWKCGLLLWWHFFPGALLDGFRKGNQGISFSTAFIGRLLTVYQLPDVQLQSFAEGLLRGDEQTGV